MNTLRRHLPASTWLALAAMIAMVLLPTLSHALTAARGDASRWAEVCTPQGMRLVAVQASQPAQDDAPVQAAGHLEHCPLCALGGLVGDLPPAPFSFDLAPTLGRDMPALFLHAPATLHAWRSAQPRGPPAFS